MSDQPARWTARDGILFDPGGNIVGVDGAANALNRSMSPEAQAVIDAAIGEITYKGGNYFALRDAVHALLASRDSGAPTDG